jgi:uncharacterized protein (DUF302 family)
VQDQPFTFTARLAKKPLAEYRPAVEAALKAEGFGVPTEMDVQALLKERLGVDRAPFLILGACNPALSHRILAASPEVGALLPCNVVLREDDDAVVVEMIDPRAMLGILGDNQVAKEVAEDARARLQRAMTTIETEFAPAD